MSNITLSEGEFLGWHLGDGCISKNERYYEYTLTGDIKEELSFYKKIILPKFNNIFDHYFDKKIEIKKYNSVGVCGIYIFDKGFVNLLQNRYELDSGKKINIGLPEVINSKSLKKRFLRGLFDTDGSIYFCKSYSDCDSVYTKFHYRPKIRISTISKKLMEEVNLIMNTLGIKSRLEKPRKQKK